MKTLILSLLLALGLMAQDHSAKYDISMKMLGEIGKSTLSMHQSDEVYEIKMHIQMDKSLKDEEHSYESYGHIENGVYVPERFVKYIREGDKEVTSYYIFNHENKQIEKYTTTKENKSIFGIFSSDEQVVTKNFELLTEFTENDTLTTFLNAKRLLKGKSKMAVNSVGFRKDERNISLHHTNGEYKLTIKDKEASDDYAIHVSIAPDGLIENIMIQEYTMLGNISVERH